MDTFPFSEKHLSQLPALQLLVNLGYRYLTPAEALAARGGRRAGVLLEEVLREAMKRINRIRHKGASYLFSEENVQSAIQRLKGVRYDGLLRSNEALYDLLTLGVALEQAVEGDLRSFTLHYIDWRHPENNRYHVTAELAVERSRSRETARPDIVLFVNGIPFATIECKSPAEEVGQAVSQTIRNQRDDYIPALFGTVQLVIASNKNECRYATVGTPAKYWAVWREEQEERDEAGGALRAIVDRPLPAEAKAGLYELPAERLGVAEEAGEYRVSRGVPRALTGQDRTLYALCRPERLLRLALPFTVFDGGRRKVARYQQFFAVERILAQVKGRDGAGRRAGGIVWHTQGSGKSLTMVMLAKALMLEAQIPNPRIVLVTDRVDLDRQLGHTFAACGLTPERADSGRHLVELVADRKAHVVTTLVHKFDKALANRRFRDDSGEIFVLVDETQRTQLGMFAARMRQMFPNACYIGFTGTPLLRREKSDVARFGGILHRYAIDQAVADGVVVPLLYEGRLVEIGQNRAAVDLWFERHTAGLSRAQQADLKKKYARAEMLNKSDQVIYMRAFDIGAHYRRNWQGTGFKAQLVAPSKAAAIRYHTFLEELGEVSSAVVISAPDRREGFDEVEGEGPGDDPKGQVAAFWARTMRRYGSAEEYEKQLVNAFKFGAEPEILIVVDKLLTGFDAPLNTVLYLTRKLREHTLLQAVARVNRLYDDEEGRCPKEFGYVVDYAGVLGDLDRALTAYSALEGYDEADLAGALAGLDREARQLPQRHAELLDLFKGLAGRRDEEAYEQLLGDERLRAEFYDRLAAFARTLAIALSSESFITRTPQRRLDGYKGDLQRFYRLKAAVQLRYAEAVDYRDYEPKLRKLLNTHITADEVLRLNQPVNIFDREAFRQVVAEQGEARPAAARADTIAHATKRAVGERLGEDPAFYERFSQLIQQAIDDYRAGRISDLEYLQRAEALREAVLQRKGDDVPAALHGNDHAIACYGVLAPCFAGHIAEPERAAAVAAEAAAGIWARVEGNRVVGFWDNQDAQRTAVDEIDDYLYDVVRGRLGVPLTTAEMDEIIDRVMQLARYRMPS